MSTELQEKNGASASSLILIGDAFDRMEKLAELMASGKSTIPDHLRNKGDCMAIIMQSMQWRMNPLAVAQKTHVVSGKLGYEAQLVAAVINSSGVVRDRFRFEFFGPWERIIGKFEIRRGDKGEYRVPGWKLVDEEGVGVVVSATIKGESEPRHLELFLAQARVRNSGLWADDPKQQLCYLAQKKWARLYAPDVIMGVYSVDEFEQPEPIDMGPIQRSEDQPKPGRPALAEYPDDRLEKMIPKWCADATGDAPAETIIATLSSKYALTEAQKERIRKEVVPPINGGQENEESPQEEGQ